MDDSEEEKTTMEIEKARTHVSKVPLEAKLRELLHNITSLEIKLCSDATKQFKKLLKGDDGSDLLRLYVQTSSELSELLEAWNRQQGKSGMLYIFSLISELLSHPDGKYVPNDKERIGVSSALDKFARWIIKEKKGDVNKELNSNECKRQRAALLLMDSIVRRGSGLAYYVAQNFASELPLSKLAVSKQKGSDKKGKHLMTMAFIRFAMSFLEVGKPESLNLIVKMCSSVLCGLENGDDETIIYVLSTLRNSVLTKESLVPRKLRSVLFGRDTLEQLVSISGREQGGPAAELAHSVLVMVCTDPCNGLMPDMTRHPNTFRGNPKRLLALMKKSKAAENDYHRDLLLAIVMGRPFLGSAYMEEFPYNLEDHESPTWFANVSLAADLVCSVGTGLSCCFPLSHHHDLLPFGSADVQVIKNCICPRPFSRSVISKGLRHSNFLVKNGVLRLLLEMLKLLDSFVGALNHGSCCSSRMSQRFASLKQEIQEKVRTLLPDPQDLLTLLSPLTSKTKTGESTLKRKADIENFLERSSNGIKKLKATIVNDEKDIIISGIGYPEDSKTVVDTVAADELDNERDVMDVISEIWGPDLMLRSVNDAGTFFQSKLLVALTIYLRTMPTTLQGSFDFFMNLLSNSLEFPVILQSSLLSLLIEHVAWRPGCEISVRAPPLMYKHLRPFLKLLISSTSSGIKDQAYKLAQAAMLSTGAFDRNLHEIDAWFLFLPGFVKDKIAPEVHDAEVHWNLSSGVISFLCDAISTVGNNLFRYWDIIRQHTRRLKGFKDVSPHFSPLVVCVLQKCLKILNSESGNFSLSEKSLISLYVCNAIKYLLETQVDPRLLAALSESILSDRLEGCCFVDNDSGDFLCEWRPLKNLLLFSQGVSHEQACCIFPLDKKAIPGDSFASTIEEVKNLLRCGHGGEIAGMAKAFFSAIVCTTRDEMLKNFPSVMAISQHLRIPVSLLSSIVFLEQNFLVDASKLWPEMFFAGLEMALSPFHDEGCVDGANGNAGYSLFEEAIMCNADDHTRKSVTLAFSSFLKQAPFHALFPAIISIDVLSLSNPSNLVNLLLSKLSTCASDCLISYLRLVLFWSHHVQLSYRNNPSINLNQQSEICFVLVNKVFAQLFCLKPDSEGPANGGVPISNESIREAAETIFCHPAVTVSLTCPLRCDKQFTNENMGSNLETFIGLSRELVHTTDQHVLDMLTATMDYLFFPSMDQYTLIRNEDDSNKTLVQAFDTLTQSLFLELRKQFDLCIGNDDLMLLLPPFGALHALIRFVPPLKLLELAHWMFGRVDMDALTVVNSHRKLVLSIGFFIAGSAFETLAAYLQQSIKKRGLCDVFWEADEKYFDELLEEVYVEVCKFATKFGLDLADECLLKAVNVIYMQKYTQHNALHPVRLVMSRVIMNTPTEIISHCLYRTNRRKAKLLFLLTEISPLHLSVFGHLFFGILHSDFLNEENEQGKARDWALSVEDYIMLLPAALSYMKSVPAKFGQQHQKHFYCIPSFYARMLSDGLPKKFASECFQEECEESFPSSGGDLLNFFNSSLLGKAVLMLQYHFASRGESTEISLVHDDELLDYDVSETDSHSYNWSLNLINRVIAKIKLGRMLLFPEDNPRQSLLQEAECDVKEISVERGSSWDQLSRMRFINMLVATWQRVLKKFPSVFCRNERSKDPSWLYKYLEDFILKSILELVTVMRDDITKLQSIPFLEQMMRSSLLYRFEDPKTLKMLQNMLTLLSEGKFPHLLYLRLLLAHSQFAPTIGSVPASSTCQTSAFLRPISSILRSIVIPDTGPNAIDGKNCLESTELYSKQLEILKLLRALLQFGPCRYGFDFGKDPDISLRELHLLLLSSYGATLCAIDVEIYNLMRAIESIDKSVSENIAQTGYLWGTAALKIRTALALKQDMSHVKTDIKVLEEHRRCQFRENLPINPKICARTVLYFPYDRIENEEPLSSKSLQLNDFEFMRGKAPDVENTQRYDPVFLLRFSIHALSLGYIESMEFVGLGLLAIAFVSMSSLDVGMRKLGYETLGRFKSSLEKCQKKKGVMQLRLLLTYVQNGIEEPWQRIPSIIALFAAETSLIVLDPSNDHYSTLSEFLMRSSRANMNCIPLFDKCFWSSSVNFRTERLWILRLVYVGMNLEDDAPMYIRNSTVEILLSFYASPLSDNESKELILLVVKKSVNLQKMACHLVEHCALFPWLSSVLSVSCGMFFGEEKMFSLRQLAVALEIINSIISSRSTIEWLQKRALEQLIELSTHLYKLLIGGVKLPTENVVLVSSVLQIMMSTLKISQKRKIYQPHFTLAVEGLYKIYQAVSIVDVPTSRVDGELALRTILMSTPPVDLFQMGQEKLSNFLMWATSTALTSDSRQILEPEAFVRHLTIMSEEAPYEESLISKFQRWVIASVIIGKILRETDYSKPQISERSNSETLLSLLESAGEGIEEREKSKFDCDGIVADAILYLQQLLGMRCRVLPSVVSAVCLLLFCNATNFKGLMLARETSVVSLLSRIRSPYEANPAWRWSYYQPWKDLAESKLTDSEKMDEFQACQTLLVIVSNFLGEKSLDLQTLSLQNLENSGVFKWEKDIIETE